MAELDNTRVMEEMAERFLDPQNAEPRPEISELRDFQLRFAPSAVSASDGDGAEFEPARDFPTGGNSYSVAVGDFDGDGNLDLVTANRSFYYYGGGTVSVLLGDGTGNFGSPTEFDTSGNSNSVAVGNFNGDDNLDIVTANFDSTVSVLLGDGTGDFDPATTIPAGGFNYSVAVGDFNGDEFDDVAVGVDSYFPGIVSVLIADGTGGFNPATDFATGNDPEDVAIGDFDGDGNLDLVTANEYYGSTVSILLGDGTGNFSSPTNFGTVDVPRAVTVGDFDGDGNLDLATTNYSYYYYGGNTVSVLLGDGTGNFGPATTFSTTGGAPSIEAGDFDLDGNLDLVTANGFNNSVSVLLGDGTGNFGSPTDFGTGGNSYSVAVGEFNGDGSVDLVTANGYSQTVSVLLNAVVPGVELIGTEGDDVLTGGNGPDTISGLGGDDIIQGLGRSDEIFGGDGNDLISAGDGDDTVEGNDGQDDILGGDGDDLLNGHSGEDRILGESGDDTISGGIDSDIVDGGEGNDSVSGDEGSDRVFGGTGDDSLSGGAKADTLTGGFDSDTLDGGDGDDTLIGVDPFSPGAEVGFGAGEVDTLTGAAGGDTFVLGDENRVYYDDGDPLSRGESDFALITDFDPSQDFIQLKGPADVYSLDFFTSELGTIDADLIFDPGVSARGEVIATLQNVSTDLSVTDPSFIFV